MYIMYYYVLGLCMYMKYVTASIVANTSMCVCTTVPCPISGNNTISIGGGGYGDYQYSNHNGYEVVISAKVSISKNNLDQGTGTTTCTQEYSRTLDDDGQEDCDAGHILANRLGGPGNQPINIFPQDLTINRGVYAQYEGTIADCVSAGNIAILSWYFYYESTSHTKPYQVKYIADYSDGNCTDTTQIFEN